MNIGEICENLEKSGKVCGYFLSESRACVLLSQQSGENFAEFLLQRCDFRKILERVAERVIGKYCRSAAELPGKGEEGRLYGYLERQERKALHEEITFKAFVSLKKRFEDEKYQFSAGNATYLSLIGYSWTLMRNEVMKLRGCSGKRGYECAHYRNGCDLRYYTIPCGSRAGLRGEFPHYRSKRCRNLSPGRLKPRCDHFEKRYKEESIFKADEGNVISDRGELVVDEKCHVKSHEEELLRLEECAGALIAEYERKNLAERKSETFLEELYRAATKDIDLRRSVRIFSYFQKTGTWDVSRWSMSALAREFKISRDTVAEDSSLMRELLETKG